MMRVELASGVPADAAGVAARVAPAPRARLAGDPFPAADLEFFRVTPTREATSLALGVTTAPETSSSRVPSFAARRTSRSVMTLTRDIRGRYRLAGAATSA